MAQQVKLVPDENYGRLGTTFETESRKYFFDTGTGKVFECDEDEYKVLSYLFKYNKLASETDLDDLGKSVFEVYEGILELSEKEHILQAPKYKEFVQVSDERLKNLVGQNLQQVILDVNIVFIMNTTRRTEILKLGIWNGIRRKGQ